MSITVAEASDVLTVPVSAVIGAGDDKFVQVYDLASGEQRAEPVTTGISNGTMVEVSGEGLKEGDLVVLNEAEPAGGRLLGRRCRRGAYNRDSGVRVGGRR